MFVEKVWVVASEFRVVMEDVDEFASDTLAHGWTGRNEGRTWMFGHRYAPRLRALFSALPGRALAVSRRASRCHTEAELHLRTRGLRSLTPSPSQQGVAFAMANMYSPRAQLADSGRDSSRKCPWSLSWSRNGRRTDADADAVTACTMHPQLYAPPAKPQPTLNRCSYTCRDMPLHPHHSILVTYLALYIRPHVRYERRETLNFRVLTVPGLIPLLW